MSAYTDLEGLVLVPNAPDGVETLRRWRLAQQLVWQLGYKGKGDEIRPLVVVHEGFVTDLVSAPWWARWLINPADPRYAKAAVLHDYLLWKGWSAGEAAGVFHAALRADGVSRRRAFIMSAAVLWATSRDGFKYAV